MTALSIGKHFEVFDISEVQRVMENHDGHSNALLQRILKEMLTVGPSRYVVKPSSSKCLEEVEHACPHFKLILDDLKKYVELALYGTGSVGFVPILLAGDPGVGKTYFAKQLGQAFGVPSRFISMNGVSASWVLSGAAPTWQGAKHGKIASTLITEPFANPLFILDELDKSGGDARYDPTGTLLELLERDTAEHFLDEFLDMHFDVSQAFWVGTANSVDAIPGPLLSRMVVYEVPSPDAKQAAHIAQNIYSAVCKELNAPFEPVLREDVVEALSAVAPRDMKLRVLTAMGCARLSKRDYLSADDVPRAKSAKVVGFTR